MWAMGIAVGCMRFMGTVTSLVGLQTVIWWKRLGGRNIAEGISPSLNVKKKDCRGH